ncbi:MAG: flagellar biosynthetic protein FliO [Hyphomicrobiaceae bacterium]
MITNIIIAVLLLAALGVGGWLLKGYMTGEGTGAAILGNSRDKRTGVIEQTSVDGRRKLVLIRRDGTEHLIMTGGPVDIVIETGITPVHRPVYERVNGPTAVAEPERQPPGFARVRQPQAAQGE